MAFRAPDSAPHSGPGRHGTVRASGPRSGPTVRYRTQGPQEKAMHELFRTFSQRTSGLTGSPLGFGLAVGVVVVWALTGPLFGYSDSWQLVINTGTTIVTFLMVFLIQNTQNRDTRAGRRRGRAAWPLPGRARGARRTPPAAGRAPRR